MILKTKSQTFGMRLFRCANEIGGSKDKTILRTSVALVENKVNEM